MPGKPSSSPAATGLEPDLDGSQILTVSFQRLSQAWKLSPECEKTEVGGRGEGREG